MALKSAALEIELRIPHSHSLKDKRAVVRPILDGARRRFGVASAEVDLQQAWDKAVLAFSTVASSVGHVNEVLDKVDRFVWSFPEIEVTVSERHWVDTA